MEAQKQNILQCNIYDIITNDNCDMKVLHIFTEIEPTSSLWYSLNKEVIQSLMRLWNLNAIIQYLWDSSYMFICMLH